MDHFFIMVRSMVYDACDGNIADGRQNLGNSLPREQRHGRKCNASDMFFAAKTCVYRNDKRICVKTVDFVNGLFQILSVDRP